jgi:hypothetical protein
MSLLAARSAVVRLLFLLVPCLPLSLPAQTQQAAPTAAEATIKRPTDFRTRAELRYEYQDLQSGGYRSLVVPRFEYAESPSLAFRVETPFVFTEPDGPNPDHVSGHGDLLLRAAWRATQRDGFALILATEVTFDTASDDRLGLGKTVVAPLVYAAIDLPKYESVFFPNVQHYFSVAGDDRRMDVRQTVLKPNLLTRWPNRVYTFLEPAFIIDWERNSKVGLQIELEFGKLVSKNAAVWVRPGVGAIKDDLPQIYNWNTEIGVRYIF